MNALADYAKRISSELVLFDWVLFFQVMFAKHFFFFHSLFFVLFCCCCCSRLFVAVVF